MSSTADQGGLVVRLYAAKPRRASAHLRRAARDFEYSPHAALQQALTACLAALAELVGAAGDSERFRRVRAALEQLEFETGASGLPLAPADQRARRSDARRNHPPLSNREDEVAELIVEGLTNREIATMLGISERTADTHVQNILNKLGLVSRAQVAAWFIAHTPDIDRPRAI